MGYTLPSSSAESPRDQARALMEKKQNIEAELEAQLSVLNANNNCGMDSPLVDRDGFPRADIDVWAVRSARVRIIELRNDLNAVMNAIAKALEGVFDPNRTPASQAQEEPLKPFARVNTVSPGSPASQAVSCICPSFDVYVLKIISQGLRSEDLIVKFGHLTSKAISSSMQPVAELVKENENVRHPLTIKTWADASQRVILSSAFCVQGKPCI